MKFWFLSFITSTVNIKEYIEETQTDLSIVIINREGQAALCIFNIRQELDEGREQLIKTLKK